MVPVPSHGSLGSAAIGLMRVAELLFPKLARFDEQYLQLADQREFARTDRFFSRRSLFYSAMLDNLDSSSALGKALPNHEESSGSRLPIGKQQFHQVVDPGIVSILPAKEGAIVAPSNPANQ